MHGRTCFASSFLFLMGQAMSHLANEIGNIVLCEEGKIGDFLAN
jgi:hypothetical protein